MSKSIVNIKYGKKVCFYNVPAHKMAYSAGFNK